MRCLHCSIKSDAGHRVQVRCGFRVINFRQAVDLLDVENGLRLEKRDFSLDFVASLFVGYLWAAFAASCNLRDMGTHLCTLPTGEHCPKGLICLGCAYAQPKKSAGPIYGASLASHSYGVA